MSRGPAWIALAATAVFLLLATPGVAAPPMVEGVDLLAPHPVPEKRVRAAIGDLAGKPLSRDAVRESLERLWAMGLYSTIRVDETPGPGGVRLSYVFTERALIRRITWTGPSGLDLAEVAATAGLAIGEEVTPARLAKAKRDLLTRYHREGYLSAGVEIGTEAVADSSELDVTVSLDSGRQARVGEIRFQGDTGLPAPQLIKALKFREGAPYRESFVRDGARAVEDRLRQDGYYDARVEGTPDWHEATNAVDLDLRVTLGAQSRVEFEGLGALPESAVTSHLTFATSGSTDRVEQEASAHQIEGAYRALGYHFVTVTPQESRDGDIQVIRFAVDEGPRVTVESVTFTGAHAIPGDRLAKQIETRRPGFFRRGLFRQDLLDQDVGVVLAYLRSQGYAEATVGPAEVHFTDDRSRAVIVIPVNEGPRLTVGAVTIEGAHVVTPRDIETALPFKRGAPWQVQQAEDGQRAIERLYASRGYFGAIVQSATNRQDSTVEIRYDIDEGEQTRIGRVLLRGLLLTREDVVRRTLPFRSGDVLLPDKLLDGQRRLSEFPAFDSVSIEPLRPPPNPFDDVEVSLRERKPWHLDFGFGYSNADGVRGFAEVGHDNILGTGTSLSLRQRLSGGGQATHWAERTDALGRVPFVLGTPWWVDLDVFQEASGQLGYNLTQGGIWIDAHRELFPESIKGLRGDLRYRVESVRYSNVDPGLVETDVTPGQEFIASVTPVLTLDRRDDPLDPKHGSLNQISIETGAGFLGSDVQFVKGQLETRWFFNWPSPTVIAVAGRLGLAAPYGGTPALAIQDRFYAGGATTIRGYKEDRVGPLDARGNPTGGNARAILNLEWRFPIWRWIGGAVFVDSGTVTPEIGNLNFSAFKTGTGGALRVITPVGPLRIDIGYALQPIPGESRVQVYFTVGNPF
ncbi:MAG TPA: outer membrane protein assembly factor BamA [Candidatus Methylomirabilis sp.]|nr:outer membrane protein assembly factor BamA [Candidatus Methylomirabilis sp.]